MATRIKEMPKASEKAFPAWDFIVFIKEDESNSRDSQQVQQVDTDGNPDQVSDEDQPAVGMRLSGNSFPFQDGPESHGCKKG